TFQSAQIITEAAVYNTVQSHNDPMVVKVQIANCFVQHILINTGRSVDIFFNLTLEKINLKQWCYNNFTTLLYGITVDLIIPVGSKIIMVIFGTMPQQ
ncbi:hypothetical protein Ddye_005149, partial [Dipteronia dyeriana]